MLYEIIIVVGIVLVTLQICTKTSPKSNRPSQIKSSYGWKDHYYYWSKTQESGRKTALDLARRGGKVIFACRNLEKANQAVNDIRNETKNGSVYAMKLELNSFKSVREFVEEFLKKETRLDILINNAGILPPDDPQLTEDGTEHLLSIQPLWTLSVDDAPSAQAERIWIIEDH